MEFNQAYEFLKNYKGKVMKIEELRRLIDETEQFDDSILRGYNTVDCKDPFIECSYEFNSFSENEKVISIKIVFKIKDHLKIKEIDYTDEAFNKMLVSIEDVYLYDI